MIFVKKFVVNPIRENTYLLYDETGKCLIIDAGFYDRGEENEVITFMEENGLLPVMLLNTHCHFDHLMGVEFIRKKFGIPFICHESDAFWLKRASAQCSFFGFEMENVSGADRFISEGDTLQFGNSSLNVIHVPGHSAGHVVFYSPEDHFLFAGDVLFQGSIGRTDLPGGNYPQLIRNIRDKLMTLPPDTKVFCGHGNETTIGFEKSSNPYLI